MRPRIRHTPRLAAGALGLTLSVLLAFSGLAGCGSKNNTANPTTSTTTGSSATQQLQVIGNMLNYASFGTTADLDCGGGKSLSVSGSNDTLTVTGTCSTVSIFGADNKITFDKIDNQLTVIGLNNTVTYKNGEPKVQNFGQGNTINKG